MVRKGKEPASDAASPSTSPILTVTAQQSRFHTDAVDAPVSKEIVIKDLSISVGQRELLSHAELQLLEGRHYVLVGRNGTGKSTLLKAIADGHVPGIPWSLRILLLGQTRASLEEDIEGLKIEEETVLQHVVRSDRIRERYIREARVLSEAVDHANDPMAPVKAFRQLSHERLARNVEEARQIAARRSGARGLKARKQLIEFEEKLSQSQARLEEGEGDIESAMLSKETQAAADMLAAIQSALELMDASEAEAKARTVLLGLGFSMEKIDNPISQLSGGWKTRCDLACALCQYADVLLLDEPTNFLDLPSIIWLQEYVRGLETTTVVVVTHDRDFADAVAEELLVLRNLTLERFRGNLSLYERERHKKAKYLTGMKEAQDKQKKHMEQTIVQNVKAAKKTGDDKKLKQAASRRKKLDERMGMEVSAKGTRFKLNRDMAGWQDAARNAIEVPDFDPPVKISLPSSPPDLRFPGALVSLEKVSFSYPGRNKVPVLMDIDLTIHPGERVGLAGLNGSGKTTLVSLIMGSGEEGSGALVPTKGTITRHARAKIGRFSQQAVEELNDLATQDSSLTALSHIIGISGSEMTEKEARPLLGSLGLQGQTASDVPLSLLSGGQKVRLALAKLLWSPPHLLILDEVTTHLDADTILALVNALRNYEGALLVITHDRFFMRCLVEGESPYKLAPSAHAGEDPDEEDSEDEDDAGARVGVVYRLVKGQLRKLERGMEQYEEIAARAAARLRKAQAV
ncbi:ABC transporter ATP-binding protein uup-1 [Lepidopterella palustris CBS 459.81]|uniref:ABC transporter ATP-binding protein uup-1 n=1 Tax=Lepidopterella palustris CBS 459.81 TaxID=1314670 RepID=A0A8E2E7E0_9PEZI|nr:ABC transporter ATP-binding protein uup-1 [Lepidopterella palustris CBS 459.81]